MEETMLPQEHRKGQKDERSSWIGTECNNGIRVRGLRQQVRGKREFSNTFKETLGLEIEKRAVGVTTGLGK
jgi:ribosomal protein L15E